ncbi:MAG: hypothetical protein GWO20_16010 [Candidatus Korarchaeota archaeon]|nr:hypothetical protein [Candidatus Korarchaeota archaeon]NIU84896.1 hypothetical protein [Candidatus Thorarchaeota archaeon]NIW14922.1 hypothetical protein [Candidatus Thorarchaeota archaeon]NIW52956.1 hypothetical protein [Candidatus Korarchaeota archaeon]
MVGKDEVLGGILLILLGILIVSLLTGYITLGEHFWFFFIAAGIPAIITLVKSR